MTKIKYDVTKVEGGGEFTPPPPGLYTCKIEECEAGESKKGNKQLRIVLRIAEGKSKNAPLFHYVPVDPESGGYFRLKELIKALGLKEKAVLDTDKVVGEKVKVRVKHEGTAEDQYGIQARVASLIADTADDDDDDDDDDDGDDDDDDEGGTEDSDDDESEDEQKDESDEEDDYEAWSADELKVELKERGLRTAGKKTVLIGRLRKNDEEDDDPFEEG